MHAHVGLGLGWGQSGMEKVGGTHVSVFFFFSSCVLWGGGGLRSRSLLSDHTSTDGGWSFDDALETNKGKKVLRVFLEWFR